MVIDYKKIVAYIKMGKKPHFPDCNDHLRFFFEINSALFNECWRAINFEIKK